MDNNDRNLEQLFKSQRVEDDTTRSEIESVLNRTPFDPGKVKWGYLAVSASAAMVVLGLLFNNRGTPEVKIAAPSPAPTSVVEIQPEWIMAANWEASTDQLVAQAINAVSTPSAIATTDYLTAADVNNQSAQ